MATIFIASPCQTTQSSALPDGREPSHGSPLQGSPSSLPTPRIFPVGADTLSCALTHITHFTHLHWESATGSMVLYLWFMRLIWPLKSVFLMYRLGVDLPLAHQPTGNQEWAVGAPHGGAPLTPQGLFRSLTSPPHPQPS